MLVEFSVTNFRSFKEKQTFSMVTSKPKNDQEKSRCIQTSFKAVPAVLKTTAIFGANASGKSNLMRALKFVERFVHNSSKETQKDEPIANVTSYAFSKSTQSKPSEFEIVFIHKGHLYQYGFTVDSKKVHEEWLYITSGKSKERQRPQRLIERNSKDVRRSYINPALKGEKEQWKSFTRDNALILSTAVSMNASSLVEPFHWLVQYLNTLNASNKVGNSYSRSCLKNNDKKQGLLNFIQSLDIPIADFVYTEKDFTSHDVPSNMPPEQREAMLSLMKEAKVDEVFSIHKTEEGSLTKLSLHDESDGTQKIFSLSGPILDVLQKGYTLAIDELNSNLHPLVLARLIALFENDKTNPHGAQLIFTSHDTNVMGILGRDNIWTVERSKYGASHLVPLSSIEGRPGEAVEKRYLAGRYGGVPTLGDALVDV